MNPAMLGLIIGLAVFLLLASKRSGERTEAARRDAAEKIQAAAIAEAQEKEPDTLPQVATAATKYVPKGDKMKKPVFLPTEAPSLLQEDPVVPWEPVAIIDEDGLIDWDKTEANAVYMNPATGELIEYGHK